MILRLIELALLLWIALVGLLTAACAFTLWHDHYKSKKGR
jgi:hypothetical protein